ncbi:MAG: Uma2 family endonuclease [Streptosporangiaceae bacterium]
MSEFRYELDDGVLIVSPAPSRLHQLAVARLTVILSAACPAGVIVFPGVGVNITKFQHRVPDVAVVRADAFETFFQETPPELVVEVASPRTRLYDRNRKKDVYQGFGIPGYWIVEPDRDRPELTVFELRSGAYERTAHVTGDEEYQARRRPSNWVSFRTSRRSAETVPPHGSARMVDPTECRPGPGQIGLIT